MRHGLVLATALLLTACGSAQEPTDTDSSDCLEQWVDADGDGFGDAHAAKVVDCERLEGYVDNALDCDDSRADVNPDAVEVCDPEGIDEDCSGAADDADPGATGKVRAWPDADGDGFGDDLSGPSAWCVVPDGWVLVGGDCDDAAAAVHPDAVEVCDDADIDEDCNGLAEDADPGATGKHDTWLDADGDGYGDDGDTPVAFCDTPAGRVTLPGDCDDADADVSPGAVEVCDPDDVDEDCSGAADDADPNAVGLTTVWPDADGDGFGDDDAAAIDTCDPIPGTVAVAGDCDDADPDVFPGKASLEDAAACMADTDGDGWGDPEPGGDVTPGTDCAPEDPAIHPGATDPFDGIDQDCDAYDGAPLFDGFETGAPDTAVWAVVAGNVAATTTYVGSGTTSLDVYGNTGVLESVPYDTTDCDTVFWSYLGMNGGAGAADAGDYLYVEYWDGADWALLDRWEGGTTGLNVWNRRSGSLNRPSAFSAGFKLRIRGVSTIASDHFYIDDVSVGCGVDGDGDGTPDLYDCDADDADHWSDCGACVDGDGDGFGDACDLGEDCDDADAAVHPGAADPEGDGVDADCSGVDGGGFFDDFEAGAPGARWLFDAGVTWTTAQAWSPTYALELGQASEIRTTWVDLSACADGIHWSYRGIRKGPDAGEALVLSIDDGSGWIVADAWDGDGTTDGSFQHRWGVIPRAGTAGAQLRLQGSSSLASETWIVDDFDVRCLVDADADGVPDGDDCDPTDPLHWSDCGRCVDQDGDGRGAGCDLGRDCVDTDPTVYPGAPDPVGDGVDTSCDGLDGAFVYDGFESGAPSPYVWSTVAGALTVTDAWAGDGRYALDVAHNTGVLESNPLDLSTCGSVFWHYLGMTGGAGAADTGDFLHLEFWDGGTWRPIDVWEGGGPTDVWSARYGIVTDPAALHSGFRLRFRGVSTISSDHFYIDEVLAGCADGDADGDGLPLPLDCDDTDPDHWFDCGACVDTDGDGYGYACDLGPDCDDGDPTVHPGAADTTRDGVDQDCDILDGPALLADDFESGGPDAAVWPVVSGSVSPTATYVGQGATALDIAHDTGLLESAPVDASACDTVVWRFLGMNGGAGAADAGDFLHVEYWDGAAWVTAHSWEGGPAENVWKRRHGLLSDASARHGAFRIRLRSDANLASDHYYVDDLAVGCAGADLDGDGYPSGLDCDDGDADHWSDCGLCADVDGDGYGLDCDLGPDCDEADALVNPGSPDTTRDGVDQNCDALDGDPLFAEDFETGGPDPLLWSLVTGNVAPTTTYVANGTTAIDFFGSTGVLESAPIDTRACDAVVWRWLGMNGGAGAADAGDFLYLEWFDGASWVLAHTWEGGVGDGVWRPAFGIVTDPAAQSLNFQIRLSGDSTITSDHFYLDDIQVGCAGADGDGDGMPSGIDCDDGDPWHWSDCGLCTDADGDGYGEACDLGPDCDDDDAAVNPGAADPFDGVDQNCDDVDGAAWTDDLDAGATDPSFWSSVTGDHAVVNTAAASGSHSLQLGGGGAIAETVSFDTSACDVVTWSFMGRRGPEQPDATDVLYVQWWDGAAWRTLEAWAGDGTNDPTFTRHYGFVGDPAAIGPDFRLRFDYPQTTSGAGMDQFYIDDVTVGCSTPDGDADGVPDSHDCDPQDPWHWADCGLCVDIDGDGFGFACDLGGDCDDADASTFPGAVDVDGDGIDADCSGKDGQGLFDDFEEGALGAWLWQPEGDHVWVQSAHVASGTWALRVEGGGVVETRALDLGVCNGLAWSYEGKRGPATPEAADTLALEILTTQGWQLADSWAGGATDPAFSTRSGVFVSAALDSTQVQVRLVGNGIVGDDWFVDDLWVRCLVDDDGDLVPDDVDCAPDDPWHWADCGLCVDTDGDGFGLGCDLGEDCDDADPTIHPDAPDLGLDGFDQDCDFIDGPPLVFDDFETGGPDPAVWSTISGDVAGTAQYVGSGSASLDVYGNTGVLESAAVDTSVCQTVVWRYLGMNGGAGAADAGDFLHLEWWDGAAWIPLDVWEGGPAVDWHTRFGLLNDPAAMHPGFAVRLRGDSTITSDHFYLDDFAVGCAASDNDGDGVPNGLDCDDDDAAHWSDCGLCVDVDGDGFGELCDLGRDCDDADAAVHPGAPDPLGDGLDTDCSGVDGVEFFDDFETGAPDARWLDLTRTAHSSEYAHQGAHALEVGRGGDATTLPLDLSTCTSVLWSYQGKREGADAGELLRLSWSAGGGWVEADAWNGDGSTDPAFVHRWGIIHDAAILAAGVHFRLQGNSSLDSETWFVDDLTITCDPVDNDGDGFPTGIDCDDADFWHWSDCGLCVDLDGDGFGQDCDLGEDCDDADVLVNPAMPDNTLDGLDANCDTLDLAALQDDFEGGPGIFVAFGGQNAVIEPVGIPCGVAYGGGCGDVLHLEATSDAETTTWDSTSCATIGFAFEGRRGPATPEVGDDVVVEWSTGMGWTEAYRWAGGAADPTFVHHSGQITDPAAFAANLRLRFASNGITGDDWYIDDVRIGCVD